MSANESKRVALLAREGQARDKLRQTLREVGADIVLEADPTSVDLAELKAASSQVVLVALEPVVEDSLSRIGDVLHDPGISVIFDDAELAAQRNGWDAQRWARHLSAKVHGHQDVLPPGREIDEVAELRPGRPATPAQLHAGDTFEPHVREARDTAPALPQDGLSPVDEAVDGQIVAVAADEGLSLQEDDILVVEDAGGLSLDVVEEAGDAVEAGAHGAPFFQSDEPEAWQPPARAPEAELVDGFGGPRIEPEPERIAAPQRIAEPPPLPPEIPAAPVASSLGLSGLTLELESLDDTPVAPTTSTPAQVQPAQGAVLLFAGIGGPDAVRRVLAELPRGFARPVLLLLRLDGGRYDNLVRQMERVSQLPVKLATAGETAQRSHVYVVPDEVAVRVEQGSVSFDAGATDAIDLIAALPPMHSSVLLLSGSDPSCVDAALALSLKGAYVGGQSPQGCYDPAASKALQIRGGAVGAPSELAAGVIQHG